MNNILEYGGKLAQKVCRKGQLPISIRCNAEVIKDAKYTLE